MGARPDFMAEPQVPAPDAHRLP